MNDYPIEYKTPTWEELKEGDRIYAFHPKDSEPFESYEISEMNHEKLWTTEGSRPLLRSSIEHGTALSDNQRDAGRVSFKIIAVSPS